MKYKVITQSLDKTIVKWPADGANYIEFINQGDAIAYVDDVAILPLGSWSPAPPVAGDEDFTQYNIRFAPGTLYDLVSVRKYYIKE